MSYARQDSVSRRLHLESIRALEEIGARHLRKVMATWMIARTQLKMAILEAYHLSGKPWTLPRYRSSGGQGYLHAKISSALEQFRAASKFEMKNSFNNLYKSSILRHAWILDQVTPASRNVVIPHRETLHEAAIRSFYSTASGASDWQVRWDTWIDAYRDALGHNIALEAMNQGSLSDAIDEVDATKANTPASTLDNALGRIFEWEGTNAIAQGENAVAELNDDLVEEEIWKTRGDLRVCDECDDNEGSTAEEADGDIPLHPNCHCYWLIVPASFAALLKSGNSDDRDLAELMLSTGVVPNALVIRDQDGNIAAKAIVEFNQWARDNSLAVSTK